MSQSSDEIEDIMLQSLPSDSMSSPESHAQDGQAPQDDDEMQALSLIHISEPTRPY